METNRQKKIAGVIQKDLAEVLQYAARDGMKGVIISITSSRIKAPGAYIAITRRTFRLFNSRRNQEKFLRSDFITIVS